jgi:hypothetical protein
MRHLRGVASSVLFVVDGGEGDLVRRGCSIPFGDSGSSGGGEHRGNGSHGCIGALNIV